MEGGPPSVTEGRGGGRVAFGERDGVKGGSPSVREGRDGGRAAFGERGTGWREGRLR